MSTFLLDLRLTIITYKGFLISLHLNGAVIRDSSRILAPGMGIVRLHPTQLEAGVSQYRNSGLNTRFNPLIILCFNWIFSIWLLIHSFSVSSELFDTYISASLCHLLSALQVVLLTFHLCGSIVELRSTKYPVL